MRWRWSAVWLCAAGCTEPNPAWYTTGASAAAAGTDERTTGSETADERTTGEATATDGSTAAPVDATTGGPWTGTTADVAATTSDASTDASTEVSTGAGSSTGASATGETSTGDEDACGALPGGLSDLALTVEHTGGPGDDCVAGSEFKWAWRADAVAP